MSTPAKLFLLLTAASAALGCGSGDDAPAVIDARFVVASVVAGPDEETTYVSLLPSLDGVDIDLARAYEFPGRASITSYGGHVFLSGGERPTITRYVVANGTLIEDGVIDFANEGLPYTSPYIDDWGNTFISPHKAYLSNSSDVTIVWDPTTLEITGRIEQPELVRDLPLTSDGSPGIVRGNRLYRTFFWKDWDAFVTYPEQYLAVYDVENDTLIDLVPEQRCPGMNNNVSVDEAGNIYFSNWVYNVVETLVHDAPTSCALRLPPGAEAFDPAWQLDFTDVDEGREGAALSYVSGGRAVFAAFYDENVAIDEATDLSELALSANWRLWSVDLETRAAAPLAGVDWLAGGYSIVHVDGRTFLMVPTADYASTSVHEIDASGSARLAFEIPGDSYQIIALQ